MQKDISVIGGSAAGFLTASVLARSGARVRLFEASERIDPPLRSLIVTPYMKRLIGPEVERAKINEISRFELFTDGRAAKISLREPDLVVERSMLIKALASAAGKIGVRILTNSRFLHLRPNHKKISFWTHRDGVAIEESAEVIVGADGARSKVARSTGWPTPERLPLIQAVVNLPVDQSPDTARVWFVPHETPYFYWLIPHSSNQGVLGLIAKDKKTSRSLLGRFLDRTGLEPIEFQDAEVPIYSRWFPNGRRIGEGQVYLVGDAAGHVKVSTVGGVVTGLRGAVGVAEAILNGGPGKGLRNLKRELDRHKFIRNVLNGFRQSDYSSLLDLMSASARHSLGSITRDESGRLLWRVILKEPRLVLLGLRAFLSRS
ncbi:MAG: NAD(P)/FAD-dependent oxidoreductase [Desulfobacteraceae bacterium]|jgi:flavin-dependent dehydrogenase